VPLRDPARELDAVRGAGYLKWLEPGIRRSLADKNGPQVSACGPSGGLFGIDQEVVTRKASGVRHPAGCCGHFGELRVPARPAAGRIFLQTHR